MAKEQEVIAKSYLESFYIDVEELTNYWANYLNNLLYLNTKYFNKEKIAELKKTRTDVTIEKLKQELLQYCDDNEKQSLITLATNIRIVIARCYARFNSLKQKIDSFKEKEKKLDTLFKSLTNIEEANFLPSNESLQEFVFNLHELLTTSVIQDALSDPQNIYSRMRSPGDSFEPTP